MRSGDMLLLEWLRLLRRWRLLGGQNLLLEDAGRVTRCLWLCVVRIRRLGVRLEVLLWLLIRRLLLGRELLGLHKLWRLWRQLLLGRELLGLQRLLRLEVGRVLWLQYLPISSRLLLQTLLLWLHELLWRRLWCRVRLLHSVR